LRTEQLDNRLVLNLALFHADRNHAQLENWIWDEEAGLWIGYLDSAGDVSSYGAELQTSYDLGSHVQLYANLGWLRTEIDAIEVFDLDLAQFVTRRNRDTARAPRYQYNIGARLALDERWSGQLELEGQDDSYFGYYHDGRLDDFNLINASLQWQYDPVAITLWGRNLGDQDYAVHGLYVGADPRDDFGNWMNRTYVQLGEPRTFGVTVRYDF